MYREREREREIDICISPAQPAEVLREKQRKHVFVEKARSELSDGKMRFALWEA